MPNFPLICEGGGVGDPKFLNSATFAVSGRAGATQCTNKDEVWQKRAQYTYRCSLPRELSPRSVKGWGYVGATTFKICDFAMCCYHAGFATTRGVAVGRGSMSK